MNTVIWKILLCVGVATIGAYYLQPYIFPTQGFVAAANEMPVGMVVGLLLIVLVVCGILCRQSYRMFKDQLKNNLR